MKFSIKLVLQSILLGLSLCLLSIVSSYLVNAFTGISLGKQNTNSVNIDFKSYFFVAFIIPLFETFIFQWLIIYQIYESYKRKYKKQLAILLSSLLFGLSHSYSYHYFIFTTIAGIFLATSFCYFKERTNWLSAFLYVTLIHSVSNSLIFIIKTLNT
ncbi:CPBP family intramembrane metalloprotease [Flavobacterium sp. ALJ2]|nr:CPBP family intramembrane metalloprotease [Flavobacterium sp. ALJ2]